MRIRFVSGLPRSGSTLLGAILRQNPRFQAAMSSPVAEIVCAVLKSISGANEGSLFISNAQRERIVRSVFEAYHLEFSDREVSFDTHRVWCTLLPTLMRLFPDTRVVCCVRNLGWILDSIERFVQHQPFELSRMFPWEPTLTVYNRFDYLLSANGLVGAALNAFRQAWFGENAAALVVVRYESLTVQPDDVIRKLYEALGEPYFEHDFNHLVYDEPEFDSRLGMPGFHRVSPKVEVIPRRTLLPPELFERYTTTPFWEVPEQNPRGVLVL